MVLRADIFFIRLKNSSLFSDWHLPSKKSLSLSENMYPQGDR